MPRLFVRGVSERIGQQELQDIFEKYGKIDTIQTGQAGFAFVEMESERDCSEAIRVLDGSLIDGQKITVEKARGGKGERPVASKGGGGDSAGEFLCYNCNRPGHLARDCKEKPRNPLYIDTRGTKITDLSRGSSNGNPRFHPYDRPSRERHERFERTPPRGYRGYDSSPGDRRPPSDRGPSDYIPLRRGAPEPFREYPRGRTMDPDKYRYERREYRPDPRLDPRGARPMDPYFDQRRPDPYRRSPDFRGFERPPRPSPERELRRSPPPPRERGRTPPSEHYRMNDRFDRHERNKSPEHMRNRTPERFRQRSPEPPSEHFRNRTPERYRPSTGMDPSRRPSPGSSRKYRVDQPFNPPQRPLTPEKDDSNTTDRALN